jgi:Cof subfamily protein (haloacid dehalogenase superfamily)
MVIFFDIDGTIVEESTQIIPDSTIAAIAELAAAGHTPIINTGRPYSHIDPRVREMAFAGWVCAGGMEVYVDGQWLQQYRMNAEVRAAVIQAVRDCRMQVIYEAVGGFLLDGEYSTEDRVILESKRIEDRGCFAKQLCQSDAPIIKFVTFDGPDSRHAEFVAKMSAYFTCIERGGGMVEYVAKGCSKASGVQQLLQHLHVKPEETFAFGDSTNDISMFQVVGHSVCMGDGMEEAKAQASFVTTPLRQDGIANGLRHFGLIP